MSDVKTQRVASTAYALCYASVLPFLQEAAREHGYALALHGSMCTDFDLIACPWTEDSSDAVSLVESIRERVDGVFTNATKPGEKPHGRMSWTIIPKRFTGLPRLDWVPYIDISVMPRLEGHK